MFLAITGMVLMLCKGWKFVFLCRSDMGICTIYYVLLSVTHKNIDLFMGGLAPLIVNC